MTKLDVFWCSRCINHTSLADISTTADSPGIFWVEKNSDLEDRARNPRHNFKCACSTHFYHCKDVTRVSFCRMYQCWACNTMNEFRSDCLMQLKPAGWSLQLDVCKNCRMVRNTAYEVIKWKATAVKSSIQDAVKDDRFGRCGDCQANLKTRKSKWQD